MHLTKDFRRLAVFVDELSVPFHPKPFVSNVYKRELHTHVGNGSGSNLRVRLSTLLALNMEASRCEMTNQIALLFSENERQLSLNILPKREYFEILYRLNRDNLCVNFYKDLDFRFSWVIILINRFSGKQRQRLAIVNYPQEISQSIVSLTDSVNSIKYVTNSVNFLS